MPQPPDESPASSSTREPINVLAARTLSFDEVMAANRRDAGPSQDYGPLVREIRDRLRALARREVQLREREAEVQRRLATLDESQGSGELNTFKAPDLEARRAELERLSRELHERRIKLDATEAELIERAAELGSLQMQLSRSVDWIQQRKAADRAERMELRRAMGDWRTRHGQARTALRKRIATVREALATRKAELEKLTTQQSAEHEANAQRIAEVEAQAEQLQQREQQLLADFNQLEGRARELSELETTLQQRESEISARESAQQASAAEFETKLAELVERQRALEERQTSLDARDQEINEREAAVSQRESDQHALQEANEAGAAALEREQLLLNEEADKLRTRSEELTQREQALAERETQLRDAEEAAVASQTEATEQRTQLEHERKQLETRAMEISARQAELTQREMELQQKQALLKEKVHSESSRLNAEHEQLNQKKSELEVIAQTIGDSQATLEFRQFILDEKVAKAQNREQQLSSREEELTARQQELTHLQQQLEAQSAELASQQGALSETEQSLLQRRAAEDAARESQAESFKRQQAELEARAKALEESQEALQRQHKALDERKDVLAARDSELDARQTRLEEQSCELASQQGSLTETEEELEKRRAAHEQALEDLRADRAEVETERVLLEEERHELDEAREKQLAALESAVEAPAPAPIMIPQPVSHSWPRTILIGLVGGALAASLVWLLETPNYNVHQAVQVKSEKTQRNEALATHELGLKSAYLLPQMAQHSELAAAWRQALDDAVLHINAQVEKSQIDVIYASHTPDEAGALITLALKSYQDSVNDVPDELIYPAEYPVRLERRAQLQQQRQQVQAKIAELTAQLEAMPVSSDRDAAAQKLQDLRQQHAVTNAELVMLREKKAQLERERPPVVVPEAQIAAALEADPVYQQDLHEFRVSAHAYQRQYVAALEGIADTFTNFGARFHELETSLGEQRELSPPPAIRAALDTLSEATDPLRTQIDDISSKRPGWLDTAQKLDPETETATLIEVHNESSDAYRRMIDMAAKVVEALNTSAAKLGQTGDGGARQRVLAALLRTDARDLTDVAAALSVSAQELSISENFELDAYNRKVRGLKTRISRRRAETEQRLQMEAGIAATNEHTEALSDIAEKLDALEHLQQNLVVQITEQWETLQAMEVDVAKRRVPELDREAQQRRLAVVDEELAQVEDEIKTLAAQAIHPDRISIEEQPDVTMVAGMQRTEHSTLAGAGAALLLGGLNWLLTGKKKKVQS